jgi:hypothetical protein
MPRLPAVRAAAAIAAALIGVAGWVVALAPAASASDPPTPTVSKTTLQRGESVTVSGTGCYDPDYDPYGGEGRLGWWVGVTSGPLSGSTQTNEWDGGAWSITMVVGESARRGTFSIVAHCFVGTSEWDYPGVTVTLEAPPEWWEPGGGGPPKAGPAPSTGGPTAARTTASTAPRTTAPSGTPAPASPPAPPVSATTPSVLAATPAAGCVDCERITGGGPLVAGQELRIAYSGFQPRERVTIVMRSTPVTLGVFVADASGDVTARITIPVTAEEGSHTLTLSGAATGDRVLPFELTGLQGAQAAGTGPVPENAGFAPPLLFGAASLVLLGGAVAHAVRRRDGRAAQETATPISEPTA